MNEDTELLRRFADEGAQEAFAELVRRKVDLVYAAALRQTNGDTHLAHDVTQGVFLALACRASALKRHAVLAGWLYTTTRFVAAKAVRTQARWQRREQEANTMSMHAPEFPAAWTELRPVIDEAMHEIAEKDRVALLLRFFEGKSLAEIGAATGLAENSVRMRVDRALEKLRARLARRGITSTATALGAALMNQPAVAAPAGFAATAAGYAMAGAAGSVVFPAAEILAFMSMTKAIVGVAFVALIFLAGIYFGRGHPQTVVAIPAVEGTKQSELIATLRADNARLKDAIDRLGADRVAAAAESRQARARMSQVEAQLQSTQAALDKELRVQKQRVMLNNLRRVAAARDQFQRDYGRLPTVADLVGPDKKFIQALDSADGEDYASLDLSNAVVLSIKSANGISVSYYTVPPGGVREAWDKALRAYQAAHKGEDPPPSELHSLASYFETAKDGADFIEWLEARGAANR